MILSLLRKDPVQEAATALFTAAVDQARAPLFYEKFGVADTAEGRFEMLAMHVYLVLRRLKDASEPAERLSQRVLDAFFANLDASLREMGVGDLSVGKKIRALAESFYGRISAYEAAMKPSADVSALEAAVSRNVYEHAASPFAPALARYFRAAAAYLGAQPVSRIANGVVRFPDAAESLTE
ncbi:MAG: ubiquinol-cytochrome C chaperone family protein [Pseudomonadota bacterium]|nr:ubiquinol-cytochrome C chaperone family protein [Pseudomonadota bacterium]